MAGTSWRATPGERSSSASLPTACAATWEYGDAVSWIEVAVTPEGDGARVTLEHLALPDEHWGQFGPGAVGIGWDLAVVGLTLHLETGVPVDAAEVQAWTISPDGLRFMTDAGTAWGEADAARGEDPEVARAAAERTIAAYTTLPEA